MKVPIEWLKEYVNTNKSPDEISESFSLVGLMKDKASVQYTNGLYKTTVLDLEHRMDRSDWLGIIGCARDFAAFEQKELKYPNFHKEKGKTPEKDRIIEIKVECPDLVNRFNTRVFRNITVKDSPKWLKNRLEAYGIPSINNIVDITNYVMVELGQPMHAQDISKLETPEITLRKAKNGEKVTTLLGETIELTKDQFVLSQGEKATVIGGIVGGNTTSVDKNTTDIVLDAGNYNQTNVRKSSRALKIQNETVQRYDKFLHPHLTQVAIERAAYLILKLAGGDYYENVDWYPKKVPVKKMTLSIKRIKDIGGMDFNTKQIENTLTKLEYKILDTNQNGWDLEVPYFRTDVQVEDDIVADIYRIFGYPNIPIRGLDLPTPKNITPEIYLFEQKLADIMVNLGFHEHITDPLTYKNEDNSDQIVLSNALTKEKEALRTNIYSTLKNVLEIYEKQNIKKIRLFEIGKVYHNIKGKYKETRVLEAINNHCGKNIYENSNCTKKLLAGLFLNLGIQNYTLEKTKDNNLAEIFIDGVEVGVVKAQGFSILTENLLPFGSGKEKRIISEFENLVTENLSLLIDKNKPFGPVFQKIKNFHPDIKQVRVLEEYIGEKIEDNRKSVLVEVKYLPENAGKIRADLLLELTKLDYLTHREI